MELADLELLTYVIKIKPHVNICKRFDLDPDRTYYHAIKREGDNNDAILYYSKAIRITDDLALAEIYETGADAKRVSKTLEIQEVTRTSVHPVSSKIFFEATLMGLRQ